MPNDLRAIREAFAEAKQLAQQGRHDEARREFIEVQRGLQRLGLRSPELVWHLAVMNDVLGEHARAFVLIRQVLAMDPIASEGLRSYEIIATNLRRALADPARPHDAADTPRLYGLLLDAGAAETLCHVAMARHHVHFGKGERAVALLEAVVALAPTSEEAWRALADAAKACGRQDILQRATAALVGLGCGRGVPFLSCAEADA